MDESAELSLFTPRVMVATPSRVTARDVVFPTTTSSLALMPIRGKDAPPV
jgi:hypothetical protein